ncbi:MAG TPA: kelch repeat-containing protein [Chloroflexia bacterium]|nr:kelch repeat-containing protein [Chloroflexia bacterium]
MRSMFLIRVACAAMLLASTAITTLAQAPQPTCMQFQQTSRQVCGRFLEYWQQNGGLAQQGLPISPEMQEKSDTDGKTYTVQYFERAVFEAHPENQQPYDVLLTLLGAFEYRRKYPSGAGAPNQRPNTTPGSVLFQQTGKRVGGKFLQYWQANGGLAQQGYPISDEFQERSDTDGKTYTVQYFERAVFELHTENQPPNDVLLSLLGRFRYTQKYSASATPNPTAQPGQLRAGQGRWLTKAPIPTPRSEVAVAEVNGKIYVLGGFSTQGQAIHEEYDPATDKWRSRAALPRPLNHAGAVGLNGKLYMVGGYGDNGRAIADTYEYDPATDKWRPLASMPTPRGALGVAVLGSKIYAIGGRNNADVGANEVYDPATNAWAQLSPMPTPRDHLGVAALDGKIYAVGGRFDTFARNTGVNEMFDPATGRWQTRAAMPTPRSGIAAVVLAGYILVFGGEGNEGTFEENEAYNPAADSWVALAPMPTARHGIGAAVVDSVVYIPSGGPTPGGSQIETHEAFTLSAP